MHMHVCTHTWALLDSVGHWHCVYPLLMTWHWHCVYPLLMTWHWHCVYPLLLLRSPQHPPCALLLHLKLRRFPRLLPSLLSPTLLVSSPRQQPSPPPFLGCTPFHGTDPKPSTLNPQPSTLNPKRGQGHSAFVRARAESTGALSHAAWPRADTMEEGTAHALPSSCVARTAIQTPLRDHRQ